MGKAKRLFNGESEQTLIKRLSPTEEQREFLQTHWNALAEFLRENLEKKYQYKISTWIQGSYKFGTLIKPVYKDEEYDVDVGIYFGWSAEEKNKPEPSQIRQWVQRAITEYANECKEVKVVVEPAKERCSRAIYIGRFHIDTPVYHLDLSNDKRRLACLPNQWEFKDPKPIYKWFKNAILVGERDQLRRLIRYLKGWAAIAFRNAPESRPSSVLLTVLATEAYQDLTIERLLGLDDDDALIEVIKLIHKRLLSNKEIENPIDRGEDLNRIPQVAWDAFLTRLHILKETAQRALHAEDEVEAALIWSEVFLFLMPLPDCDEVEFIDTENAHSAMQLPEIEISVYEKDTKKFLTKYSNNVPNVGKNCSLIFRIKNREIIPENASIEWTVRNSGSQAEESGDLGHQSGGMQEYEKKENTLYIGKHYMDCIIRYNGIIYALRRVSVNVINQLPLPVRNPPKPNFSRLSSHLRRRR